LKDGRLGGGEPELTKLPLVMMGQAVIPGDYSPVGQIDLAPTIAALLGTRLPTAAQGRPLYEMLRLTPEAQTISQLQLAAQKVSLGDVYLTVIGQGHLSQATHQDLASAQQTMLNGNRAGALQLAGLVATEATAEMASAKAARIAGERLPRLGLATVGLLLPLFFTLRVLRLWGWQRPDSPMSILGGVAALVIYYGLYRLTGYTLSLSTIGDPGVLVTSLVRYAAIGVGAAAVLVMADLLYRDERRWSAAIAAGYDCGLFTVYLAALPALVGYWQHGATVRWYLPDLGLLLLHFTSLVQVAVVTALAIPIPWLVALVTWGVGRWRTRTDTLAKVS
jgi:hypothetical protein